MSKKSSKPAEILFFLIWTVVTILISYWLGQAAYSWMPPQATLEAQRVDSLFSFLVSLGAVIFLGVFGMITFAIATCRADRGDYSEGHPSRSNTKLELLWTAIPSVLVLWIAVQSYHIYALLDIEGLSEVVQLPPETAYVSSTSQQSRPQQSMSQQRVSQQTSPPQGLQSDIDTIEVTAKQWEWSFQYPNQSTPSTELHLPVNRRVRLALHSEDVLHGFYVPAFRVKQDIIPNKEIDLVISPNREGKYQLRDSQFSGTYFSLMKADVYVESPESYQQWLTTVASNAFSQPNQVSSAAFREYAHPQNLLGQRWATRAPASALPLSEQAVKQADENTTLPSPNS